MALTCINRNLPKYQNLKKNSDISENLLDATCVEYLERFNRFPRLDELPFTNSQKVVHEELNVDRNNGVNIQSVLDYTGTTTLKDAIQYLNNTFLDLEIDITPIADKGIIKIKKRPNEDFKDVIDKNQNSKIKGPIMMMQTLDRLSRLYGIQVNQITDEELVSSEWNAIMPNDKIAKAFIHNGEIYINVDRYSPDSFVHEMMHLLVGSMRFSNPEMYQQLINQVENFELYPDLLRRYEGKTRNDVKEEILITQLGKYMAGMDSVINNLSEEQLYEINYNVRRMLDSMLMGDFSTKIVDNVYNKSIKDLAMMTNSDILSTTFDPRSSQIHRQLSNLKEDLLKKGELIEMCD